MEGLLCGEAIDSVSLVFHAFLHWFSRYSVQIAHNWTTHGLHIRAQSFYKQFAECPSHPSIV